MLHSDDIWTALAEHLPRGEWVQLSDIYNLVERQTVLDDEDWDVDAPGSSSPRWQRNVRNVLQRRKACGDIEWAGAGKYLLP